MRDKYRIGLFLLVVFITTGLAAEESDPNNQPTVVLAPKIISSALSPVQYECSLAYLKPYFESVLIIEHPELQTKKSKPWFNKPYLEEGKVIIESSYFEKGNIFDGVKKFFTTKKHKQGLKQNERYVVGLEKQSRKMAGTLDIVFAAGLTKDNYAEYIFVDPGVHLYHPHTQEYLGTDLLVIGKGKIINRSEISTLEISTAKKPITIGTIMLPSRSMQLSEKIYATTPEKKIPGYILSVLGGLENIASNHVVIVSVGARDGVKVGHLLQIKQSDLELKDPYKKNKKYKIPAREAKGEIMLYDVFDKLSIGLVMKSVSNIKILDQVE